MRRRRVHIIYVDGVGERLLFGLTLAGCWRYGHCACLSAGVCEGLQAAGRVPAGVPALSKSVAGVSYATKQVGHAYSQFRVQRRNTNYKVLAIRIDYSH